MTARSVVRALAASAVLAAALAPALTAAPAPSAAELASPSSPITSRPFAGPKANTGRVTLDSRDGRFTLTLSNDFVTPETPAPHWRIIDSGGSAHLLQRLKTKDKDDRANRGIVVPEHIHDITKVQIWCAWAEVVLGETVFDGGVQMLVTDASHSASGTHTSSRFAGPKANTGTVTHAVKEGRSTLTLSKDFVTPDTPAPHWRIVDSSGRAYLLESLKTKGDGDRANRGIVVPAYVPDVAKVQIWCAWAEVVLGEAAFERPVG